VTGFGQTSSTLHGETSLKVILAYPAATTSRNVLFHARTRSLFGKYTHQQANFARLSNRLTIEQILLADTHTDKAALPAFENIRKEARWFALNQHYLIDTVRQLFLRTYVGTAISRSAD
jgi:hypothetical protein